MDSSVSSGSPVSALGHHRNGHAVALDSDSPACGWSHHASMGCRLASPDRRALGASAPLGGFSQPFKMDPTENRGVAPLDHFFHYLLNTPLKPLEIRGSILSLD